MPGYLDIHYHVRPPDNIHPTQQWNLQTHLAYGVTTIRDPHNNSMDLLSYSERERVGRLDSPRVFTTLLPLYHFQSARDIDSVRANVRRYAEFYRTEHIKNYDFDDVFLREFAEQPSRIVAAGGRVGMGSHGDFPGIGIHWEMWLHSMGGMKNHDVLRAATIWSAEAIGHNKDFGSITPGKLADMVILDANPLVDIHNTIKLKWVVKNGTIFEPFTLGRGGMGVKQSTN